MNYEQCKDVITNGESDFKDALRVCMGHVCNTSLDVEGRQQWLELIWNGVCKRPDISKAVFTNHVKTLCDLMCEIKNGNTRLRTTIAVIIQRVHIYDRKILNASPKSGGGVSKKRVYAPCIKTN